MAQPAPPDRPRAQPRLAALARPAASGERHPARDRVPDAHRPSAARISPDQTRGSPADFEAALNRKSSERDSPGEWFNLKPAVNGHKKAQGTKEEGVDGTVVTRPVKLFAN